MNNLNYASKRAPDECTRIEPSTDRNNEISGIRSVRAPAPCYRNPVELGMSEIHSAIASMLNSPFEEIRAMAKAEMAKVGL